MSYSAYRIRVKDQDLFDNLVLIVNDNPIKGNYHEAIFFRLVYSIPDNGFAIPSNRTATFQEELRVMKKAHDFFDPSVKPVQDYIKEKMEEVYHTGISIEQQKIQ